MAKILSLMPRIYFKDPGTLATLEAYKDDLAFSTDYEPAAIIAAAREAMCLLCPAPYPVISAEVIWSLPQLKLIQTAGVGYDKIDIEAAARAGIPVANTPGINSMAVVELVVASIIVLQRRLLYADREIKRGNYQAGREKLFAWGMTEIGGSRWGIIGLGGIGTHLAVVGRMMGAAVSYHKPSRKTPEEESRLGVVWCGLEELLATSDVVIVCVPLNSSTRRLIGAREIGMMKPGAILVNAARGGIVDEAAVAGALASGHLGGAALDTFENEPLLPGHPLLSLPPEVLDRVVLTPHLGGVTVQSLNRMLDAALQNCIRVIGGQRPLAVVNGVE